MNELNEEELGKAVKQCIQIAVDHGLIGIVIMPPFHYFDEYHVQWINAPETEQQGYSAAIALIKLANVLPEE